MTTKRVPTPWPFTPTPGMLAAEAERQAMLLAQQQAWAQWEAGRKAQAAAMEEKARLHNLKPAPRRPWLTESRKEALVALLILGPLVPFTGPFAWFFGSMLIWSLFDD